MNELLKNLMNNVANFANRNGLVVLNYDGDKLRFELKDSEGIIKLILGNPSLVLGQASFQIIQHKNNELTEKYKGSLVHEKWVIGFIEANAYDTLPVTWEEFKKQHYESGADWEADIAIAEAGWKAASITTKFSAEQSYEVTKETYRKSPEGVAGLAEREALRIAEAIAQIDRAAYKAEKTRIARAEAERAEWLAKAKDAARIQPVMNLAFENPWTPEVTKLIKFTSNNHKLWIGCHDTLGYLIYDSNQQSDGNFRNNIIRFYSIKKGEARLYIKDDIHNKLIRFNADHELCSNIANIYLHPTIEGRHKLKLKELGIEYLGVRTATRERPHRITHCWSCKGHLDNSIDIECVSCGGILCNCGACFCGRC